MNPHNPLAEIYTPEEMIAFLEFAKRYICPGVISRWGLHTAVLSACCRVPPVNTLPKHGEHIPV